MSSLNPRVVLQHLQFECPSCPSFKCDSLVALFQHVRERHPITSALIMDHFPRLFDRPHDEQFLRESWSFVPTCSANSAKVHFAHTSTHRTLPSFACSIANRLPDNRRHGSNVDLVPNANVLHHDSPGFPESPIASGSSPVASSICSDRSVNPGSDMEMSRRSSSDSSIHLLDGRSPTLSRSSSSSSVVFIEEVTPRPQCCECERPHQIPEFLLASPKETWVDISLEDSD